MTFLLTCAVLNATRHCSPRSVLCNTVLPLYDKSISRMTSWRAAARIRCVTLECLLRKTTLVGEFQCANRLRAVPARIQSQVVASQPAILQQQLVRVRSALHASFSTSQQHVLVRHVKYPSYAGLRSQLRQHIRLGTTVSTLCTFSCGHRSSRPELK